jgi:hypothetical protein
MDGMRREGVLELAEGESMLEREDIAAGEGELIGGSRLGVDMFAGGINLLVYSSKAGIAVEVGTSSQLDWRGADLRHIRAGGVTRSEARCVDYGDACCRD